VNRWLVYLLFATALLVTRAAPPTNEIVRLQGRLSQAPGAGTNMVFKTETGQTYKLKRNPMSEALFLDTNLLSKVLLLSGKVQDKSFEVTRNLRSVKNGKVYDLYYYCDVCSISTSAPGLCQCCREPTVLTETPVSK
jgi:hypothetical protein